MTTTPDVLRLRTTRLLASLILLACLSGAPLLAQPPQPNPEEVSGGPTNIQQEIVAAAIRLPLAALLGTVLALRPRRRGTPDRQMSVVETQIILAVVGALVMLVVGASLARAFGIVGAANLIRYRAKVDDPKDAVVMLSALGVGLASGVGLYGLAILGTLFIGAALWTIEGFEPAANKRFELTIQIKDGVGELRPKIEGILRRFHAGHEIRATSADSLSYAISAPAELRVDRVSNAIIELAPPDQIAVEWQQKRPKKEA